jgi:hypothetical protein
MPAQNLEIKIKAELEKNMRKKLNIPARQPLPQNVKNIINKAAKQSDSTATDRFVKKEAIRLSKDFYRDKTIQQTLDSRLKNALAGIKLVSDSADLQEMIDENAKMLFAKKTALENAGFSAEEAFQLILAEVSAKKSK